MKKLTGFLLSVLLALFISGATGINPLITVPSILAIGVVFGQPQITGVLYDLTAVSNFAGTNRSHILSLLVLGAESIAKGLIHTIPNKYDVIYLPFVNTAADQLQARIPTPLVSADSEYTEKVIDPKDMMWYLEFYRKISKAFGPIFGPAAQWSTKFWTLKFKRR